MDANERELVLKGRCIPWSGVPWRFSMCWGTDCTRRSMKMRCALSFG